MATTTIGGNLLAVTVIGVSLTPAAVSATTAVAQTFTVNGVVVGDVVTVSPPSHVSGALIGSCAVTAANTVSVQFANPTASSATPAAGTYKFTVVRPEGLTAAGAFEQ
ncbi:MAG: hypothetical protein KGL39_45175 [Patescibacteria group bacterium]|nr:hypothetical protein [Patescibacteria group bacterium]